MKISFIEVSGFRGFFEKCRLELPAGFTVLSGRNGVGKSSVLDAVDFLLTGTINKFDVKGAKGGGLDRHIWWVGDEQPEDCYVKVGFLDSDGDEHVFSRTRSHGFSGSINSLKELLVGDFQSDSPWREALSRTSLIRDEQITALSLDLPEQARFAAVRDAIGSLAGPDHNERLTKLVKVAELASDNKKSTLSELNEELRRNLSALTEAQSAVQDQVDTKSAIQAIERLEPSIVSSDSNLASAIRVRLSERKQTLSSLNDALKSAESMHQQRALLGAPDAIERLEALRAKVDEATLAQTTAEAHLRVAEAAATAASEAEPRSSALAAVIEHGQALGLQDGHCPLCDSEVSAEQFMAAIETTRSRLASRGQELAGIQTDLSAAQRAYSEATQKLETAKSELAKEQSKFSGVTALEEEIEKRFSEHGIAYKPDSIDDIRKVLADLENDSVQLERALYIVESSQAQDRVESIEKRISKLRKQIHEESTLVAASEKGTQLAKRFKSAAQEVRNEILTEQFDIVMPLLKELYTRLRPHADWREIDTDFGGKIRASLNFVVGDGKNPQFLFSSGQRRAAGLGFLLAIHLSRPWCKLRTLLLDDPVQHIDDYRALNLVEVLSAIRRTGHQIVVAVEDESLAQVLCRRLRSTPTEPGREIHLTTNPNGSASIASQVDILPLPSHVLRISEAS